MNEISFAAPEIAASRQRGIPTDEGELWETLRLDAERAAAGEEMLRGFLDLAVLRHDGFASGAVGPAGRTIAIRCCSARSCPRTFVALASNKPIVKSRRLIRSPHRRRRVAMAGS